MPIDIYGWVEINNFKMVDHGREHGPEYEKDWRGLFNLSGLFLGGYEIAESLFGLSKTYIRGDPCNEPLAANRGLPEYCSPQVKQEMDKIKEYEAEYGPGETGGYTHASWSEVKPVIKNFEIDELDEWCLVFDILEKVEKQHRCPPEYLRLVVWYTW